MWPGSATALGARPFVVDGALAAANHRERSEVFVRAGRLVVDAEKVERAAPQRPQFTFVKRGAA